MASALPAALKSADVQRFATRAAQLEKFKPIATYWLEYYVLQQVLTRSLHTKSPEAQAYALNLMEKLEETKQTNSKEDAIMDDVAAKAYMEQFALDTFNRADEAQRSNKVTKQTADTFQAAATFLDSLTIWPDPDAETKAKSKFAKFHALRIARAIKLGQDPNETNPKVEAPSTGSIEDGLDAELMALETSARKPASTYQQPTVESAPDSGMPSRPNSSLQGGVSHLPPAPTSVQNEPDVSPIEPPDSLPTQTNTVGDYFPTVPNGPSEVPSITAANDARLPYAQPHDGSFADTLPSNDKNSNIEPSIPQHPASTLSPQNTTDPSSFYSQGPAEAAVPPVDPIRSPDRPHHPPPTAQQSSVASSQVNVQPTSFRTDDDAVMAAQKHAKWAISALNFEDVPTAVKELRIALQHLGGL